MKKLIVVDVSNFIFRAFFAIRPLSTPDGVPVNAVYGVLKMFLKILSKYQPTHVLMTRDTAGGSFRNEMYDEYKANRSEPPEDLIPQFALIKELIDKMGFVSVAHDNYEADDLIGSSVTQWRDEFDEVLIASGDKDLMQFVGGHVKMLDTMKDVTYDEQGVFDKMGVRPDQIVDYLSMVGDSSDNIPGMRGIGAKGAAKLLLEHGTLDECIAQKDTFKGKKLTEAFSLYLEAGLMSRKLVEIVQDMDLGVKADDCKLEFYPSDELVEMMKTMGFKSMTTQLEEMKRVESFTSAESESYELNFDVVKTQMDIKAVLELVDSSKAVSIHTEYDSGDILERVVDSISVSVDGDIVYLLTSDNLKTEKLNDFLKQVWQQESLIVASEHWKRDYFYALEQGIGVFCNLFDVTQCHYILNADGKHDLPNIAREYLGYDLMARSKKDPFLTELSIEDKHKFIGERCAMVCQLVSLFEKELIEKELSHVYNDIDAKISPILSKMEKAGVMVDPDFFSKYEKELQKKIDAIEKDIVKACDGDEININSPKQVGELLFDRLGLPVIKKTKTGYSTDSEVLETLSAQGESEIPGLILQYREVGKLLSTYVKALPKLIHPKDKRLHTHFNQHVAATGRLSSNNPNLQNIPIRTELGRQIRKGFKAIEGHTLLGADYSQVELRLLAHFSNDETMIDAFNNNEDIHKQTASEVMDVPLNDVTSELRSQAKAVNFGLMYGQSSFGLASQLKISRKEAKDYITKYFTRFSKVKSYLDGLKEEAEKTGYAMTMFGRKRYLADINSSNRTIKAMAERVAINSPIQGTAADIIKKAMITINQDLADKSLKSRMLLQVHDELIFEVPMNELDQMKEIVRSGMENVVKLKVPLTVDMGIADNWYDLK